MSGIPYPATWLPAAASTYAESLDGPFSAVFLAAIAALIVFVVLAIVMVRVMRVRAMAEGSTSGGRVESLLGLIWVAAAVGLAALAISAGFSDYIGQTIPPYGAREIDVVARSGDWDFSYGDMYTADTLHVAVGEPTWLHLKSEDVVHSLSIPAFRVNQAVLPGRTTEAWFEATRPGVYDLQSNIFSGDDFARMKTAVVAHEGLEFEAWLAAVGDIFRGRTSVEVGELLYNRQGCAACHSLDGTPLVGPSFKDLYGHEFETVAGGTIVADDAYIRESILTPNVSVIAGFQPVMTPYAGKISDREIEAITDWLKTLSDLGGTTADGGDDTTVQEES